MVKDMKLGIVSAMPIEIEYVLSKCDEVKEIQLKRNIYYQGSYNNHEIIIVASGVGKTNASIYTQIMVDHFKPDGIINIGVGGGLSDKLEPFDVVLGKSFSYHDVRVKQMKNMFPFRTAFKGDSHLVTIFSEHFDDDKQGKIVSGESFIGSSQDKKEIIKTYRPLIVDMETSSIAHCCFVNDIPFISLNAVTDLADDEAGTTYYKNDKEAADYAGEKLLSILEIEKERLI
ncbi:5'-methylthioadenosine/S-adenosylhomocysteine nucleosidase [Vagococcus carniphilus]|nr:5'-methylthioadenosine/S-adenosylhomocysteine nucleosidase [Vagococcus carniphilus]MDT2865858.1 5'-methylthioadenosine/S-adenosylhomocysteine nucleosidase [Vagococcus carniphilus]